MAATNDDITTDEPRRTRGRRWLVVVAVVAVVVVGVVVVIERAPTHASNGKTALRIVAATEAADTARVHTVLDVGAGRSGAVDATGMVDFARHRGEYRLRLSQGRSTRAVGEVRWIGDDVYAGGQAGGITEDGGWNYVDAAKVHAALACLAKQDVVTAMGGFGAIDPTTALAELRDGGAALRRVGTEELHGESLTHWHIDTAELNVRRDCTSSAHKADKVQGDFDLWTDVRDRVRRFEAHQTQTSTFTDSEPMPHDAPSTTLQTVTQKSSYTIDFDEFGAPVDVAAPSGPFYDVTDGFVAMQRGEGSYAHATWRVVARGSGWRLEGARSDTGWYCYAVSDDAPPSGFVNGLPQRDGHDVQCVVKDSPNGLFGAAAILRDRVEDGKRLLVGAATASGPAHLVFTDGSTRPLAVDPTSLVFSWSGPARPEPSKVQVGHQSCEFTGGGALVPGDNNDPCVGPLS